VTGLHIKAACSDRAWDVPCRWGDGRRVHAWECHPGHNQTMNIEWVDGKRDNFRVWVENKKVKWYLNYHSDDLPLPSLRMTKEEIDWDQFTNNKVTETRPLSWMYAKRCPEKNPEFVSILNKEEEDKYVNEEKSDPDLIKKFNETAMRQLKTRREHFDYETELEMAKSAFVDHNLVRIKTSKVLTWSEAAILA